MKNRSTISKIITALIVTMSIKTLPIEITLNDSGILINGQPSSEAAWGRAIATSALEFVGGCVAVVIVPNPTKNSDITLTKYVVGEAMGSIAADAWYGDASTKKILLKTGQAVGIIVGNKVSKASSNTIIKDARILGQHLGVMSVAALYQDQKLVKLHAAQAVCEQLAMHLPEDNQKANMLFGKNIGSAIVADTPRVSNGYIKKAFIEYALELGPLLPNFVNQGISYQVLKLVH